MNAPLASLACWAAGSSEEKKSSNFTFSKSRRKCLCLNQFNPNTYISSSFCDWYTYFEALKVHSKSKFIHLMKSVRSDLHQLFYTFMYEASLMLRTNTTACLSWAAQLFRRLFCLVALQQGL